MSLSSNRDSGPPATGPTTGDERHAAAAAPDQHAIAVARVPGLHAILNETTATELPTVRPGAAAAQTTGAPPR